LLNDHIQSLRTQLNAITIADLRTEVEALGVRLDSLIPTTTTGWKDLDKASTFSHSKIPSMLSDIAELKILSRQCHCTDEINALRKALEQKIGNIPICTYKDEVTALNAQINIIADEMTRFRQELDRPIQQNRYSSH
jgi:HAMP domain-containing protein